MLKFPLKLITAISFFGCAVNSFAVVQQSFTIPLSLGYESNPTLSASNEQPISRVTLAPSYSITSEQGPNQWFSNASFSSIRTSDQTISQDRNDPSLNLGWKRDYETGQFGITGLLNDQSTRVSELTDSGLVSGDNTRKTRTIAINWQDKINDRTSLTLGSSASDVSFTGQNTAGLVDFRNEVSNAKLGYSLSEQTEIFSQISYSLFKPEAMNSVSSEIKSINVGGEWSATEAFNLTASVGLNESKSENAESNQSKQASLIMQYKALRSSSDLNLSRTQSGNSTGGLSIINLLSLGWTYSLSERENIAFDYSWTQNLSANTVESQQVSASYTKEFSLSWDFRLSAEHKTREDQQTNTSSSSIMASIIYKLTDF